MKQIAFASISPNLSHACKFILSSRIHTALGGLKGSFVPESSSPFLQPRCCSVSHQDGGGPNGSQQPLRCTQQPNTEQRGTAATFGVSHRKDLCIQQPVDHSWFDLPLTNTSPVPPSCFFCVTLSAVPSSTGSNCLPGA